MLPMPPVEERTIEVNDALSISRILVISVFMFLIAIRQCGSVTSIENSDIKKCLLKSITTKTISCNVCPSSIVCVCCHSRECLTCDGLEVWFNGNIVTYLCCEIIGVRSRISLW